MTIKAQTEQSNSRFEHEWAAPATEMPAMRPRGAMRMLAEFHDALGDEPGRGNARLRITLHCEEHAEVLAELNNLAALEPMEDLYDLPESRKKLARELADLLYIAYGTAHAFDIDLDAAVKEVHRAAMSKIVRPNGEPPVIREDGKVLKPPEFQPPDMTEAIGGYLS